MSTAQFDRIKNIYVPQNTGTWDDLSGTTWDGLQHWITKPDQAMEWFSDAIYLGTTPTYFNLNINTQTDGIVSYGVYTSATGDFPSDGVYTTINTNDANIEAFYGQWVIVYVNIAGTGGMYTLDNVEIKTKTITYTITQTNVDSSTLGGTISAREIAIGRNVSHIWGINLKTQPTSHTLDVYVTDHPSSTTLIPQLVSKSRTAPTFKLIGLDNVARDGVVDIELIVMGEQRMKDGNLITV